MRNRIILLSVFAALFASNSFAAEGADVWNEQNKATMIQSCASEFTTIQLRAAMNKEGITGKDIPEAIKSRLPEMKATSVSICTCIIEKASEKWSLQEMTEITNAPQKYLNFIMELFCTKQCPLPSDPPWTCKQWDSGQPGARPDL